MKYIIVLAINKSSRPDVFCKRTVLESFAKPTAKHLCGSLILIKSQPVDLLLS